MQLHGGGQCGCRSGRTSTQMQLGAGSLGFADDARFGWRCHRGLSVKMLYPCVVCWYGRCIVSRSPNLWMKWSPASGLKEQSWGGWRPDRRRRGQR